jgi:hypothetical protein
MWQCYYVPQFKAQFVFPPKVEKGDIFHITPIAKFPWRITPD